MTFQFFLYLKTDDSGINLDNDSRIFQWKMIFNSDPMKEYPEIIFSLKNQMLNHTLLFYRIPFTQTKLQKNLKIFDFQKSFKDYFSENKQNNRTSS